MALTAARRDGDHAETDCTAVARAHRRQGLSEAAEASRAMNARLGSVITERCLTSCLIPF